MAELFQTTPQNITLHLRAIYEEDELVEEATCKDYLQVRTEGARQVKRIDKPHSRQALSSIRGERIMTDAVQKPETRIALFQRKEVRRIIHNNEWWFSVVDVVAVLTDSANPRDYWFKMKIREKDEVEIELSTVCRQLKLESSDGKKYETDCANTEGIFRIIQSIPSPKAEPFKRWLAKVGYERIQEIEDPELATKRTRALYKAKGYSDDWIEKRMRSIAIRDELTDEWKKRGVKEQIEYAILTAEISQATFGMTPSQYAEFKRLKRENLRDHSAE